MRPAPRPSATSIGRIGRSALTFGLATVILASFVVVVVGPLLRDWSWDDLDFDEEW